MRSTSNERGSILVIVTLIIVVLLVMVGMGLDTGQLTFVRSQGQRAVDAAALAGASGVPSGSDNEVYARVAAFNTKNDYVGGNTLAGSNVTFIQYDKNTRTVTKVANAAAANGVRVALEGSNPYGGPTGGAANSPLFLTPLFNLFGNTTPTTADISVSAIAYVEPMPGLPVALVGCPPVDIDTSGTKACAGGCKVNGSMTIGTNTYTVQQCENCTLLQVPSPKDNSCYTTYTWTSANAASMKEMINNNKTCGYLPPVDYETPINLNNGQINSLLSEIHSSLGPFVGAGNTAWNSGDCYLVPVVPAASNCNQTDPIKMWARMCIRYVHLKGSPKYILSDIMCPVYPSTTDTSCFLPKLVRDVKSGM